MGFNLSKLPQREVKPRTNGVTMMMDKGMGLAEIKDFLEIASQYVDIIKLGFGTSVITPNLKEKIKLYKDAGIPVYFGGTLFEAFVARDQFSDYVKVMQEYEIDTVEVSDGSLIMDHQKKCEYIRDLAKEFTVLSEVGSKDEEKIIAPYQWIQLMEKELEAGAWKVIAEAREGGNVGIYRGTGEVRMGLVNEILTKIDGEKVLWEAPQKGQQVWFIKLLGANVNLGNIASNEVIPLETLRIGLRGDTFDLFLKPENG